MTQLWNRRQALNLLGLSGLAMLGLTACGLSKDSATGPAGAGQDGQAAKDPNRPLVIGASNYYSAGIVAELFAQIIERNGVFVERKFDFSSQAECFNQLASGDVDIVVAYSGGPQQLPAGLQQLPAGAKQLAVAPANDALVYCVTDQAAIYYGFENLGDLTRFQRPVNVAGNSELADAEYGPAGLQKKYGYETKFVAINDNGGAETIAAVKEEKVDLVAMRASNPLIRHKGLIPLADPQSLLPALNVTGVAAERVKPELVAALDQVLGMLDDQVLKGWNSFVLVDQQPADQVVADWLANNL